jgi:hypothetical protein
MRQISEASNWSACFAYGGIFFTWQYVLKMEGNDVLQTDFDSHLHYPTVLQ